jgi:23S rRNA (uracil1939-C5)-methyltransferase
MAYGGEGMGRAPDGRMIFTAFSLPGERIQAHEIEPHKRWGRAELLKVLEESDRRISPRCRHFGVCGGCNYQHTSYQQQLEFKRSILREQLERLGGIEAPPVAPTIASPDPWNYRNRMRFHQLPDGKLSFYRWDGEGLFALEECHLPAPPIPDLWPQLSLEAMDNLDEVEIRRDSHDSLMVILHGRGAPEVQLDIQSAASVIWLTAEGMLVLAGDRYSWMEVKDQTFRLSPASFFQTNDSLTGRLVELVLEAAEVEPGQAVFDLYAGVGLFSAFMAAAGAKVTAVEESASACSDFEVNLDRFQDISLYEAPVEQALAAIDVQPETIVIDPPRAGLGKQVVEQLIDLSPERIVYVSCDPATLSRDGKRLAAAGYSLEQAVPIDVFPQTYHIESVSLWHKQ